MSAAWGMHSTWDEHIGLARLENLGVDPPDVPLTDKLRVDIEDEGLDFVDIIRAHALEVLDVDKLEDRVSIWKAHPRDIEAVPTWMTLEGTSNLKQWQRLLVNEMCIDEPATKAFVHLAQSGNYGYQEACRVLHHLLKDKDATGNPSS
eukprot:15376275-Heterocapsa_arctica.AAC.1